MGLYFSDYPCSNARSSLRDLLIVVYLALNDSIAVSEPPNFKLAYYSLNPLPTEKASVLPVHPVVE